jgi:hypothetical protein
VLNYLLPAFWTENKFKIPLKQFRYQTHSEFDGFSLREIDLMKSGVLSSLEPSSSILLVDGEVLFFES